MTLLTPTKIQESQLFTRDSFLDYENDTYGNSFFTLKLSDYSKLFSSLNLVDVRFGRKFFENDKKNWCRWTFNINGSLIDLYSASFDGSSDSYPTYIIDFCEHSTFSALQNLFARLSVMEQNSFSFFKEADDFQSNTIRSLFNNFLKTSLLRYTRPTFEDTTNISDVTCLKWSSEHVYLHFLLNKKRASLYFNQYASLSLSDSKNDGNPYAAFEDDFDSFDKALRSLNFYSTDFSKPLSRNLFVYHCKNEAFAQFQNSDEFMLKNIFEPLPKIFT